MGKYKNDTRVVLTLDAGGNSMRFAAMRGEEFIIVPITLPSNANDLDLCLETIVTGFKTVIKPEFKDPAATAVCKDCHLCADNCPTGALKIIG